MTALAQQNGVETPVFPGAGPLAKIYARIDGGRSAYLEYIAWAVADGNPLAHQWFSVFQALTVSLQQTVAVEDVCVASQVPVSELTGIVVAASMRHGADAADITAASMLPSVVHQLGKSAKRIGGEHAAVAQRDRTLFLQSTKFAPSPKGANTTVNVSATASAKAAAASAAPSMPSFMSDMGSLLGPKEAIQGELAVHQEEA